MNETIREPKPPEIAPCPLCGSAGRLERAGWIWWVTYGHNDSCHWCVSASALSYHTEAAAIAAANRRAGDQQ